MTKFTVSSLTLYAYQLASDTENECRSDARQLWDNLVKVCEEVLQLPKLAQFKNDLMGEEGQDTRFLPLFGHENPSKGESNKRWQVNITPLRLHDVYAVDFTISPVNPLSLEQLHELNPQGCLLSPAIQANLGQTLLLYLQPDVSTVVEENFIRRCIAQLWQESGQTPPKFAIEQGQLFGSRFYECITVFQAHHAIPMHLIVWVGAENSAETLQLAQEHSWELMRLLASRHKIEYVTRNAQFNYSEARKLDRELKRKNQILAQLSHSKTDKLQQLEELLQKLPSDAKQFGDHLRALNDHQFTLTANLRNYRESLAKLHIVRADDDLQLWQDFHDYAKEITALQFDLFKGYLSPTQPLFQELTQNVQGLVQIETLKHEFSKQERLERLVVFIASTLESAAISAKVDYQHQLAHDLFGNCYSMISRITGEHLTGIITHLGVGVLFGGVALGILWVSSALVKRNNPPLLDKE